jgi:hypothetical protein
VTRTDGTHWISQHPLTLARIPRVLFVLFWAGYTVGKDWALRDNARDAATLERVGNR